LSFLTTAGLQDDLSTYPTAGNPAGIGDAVAQATYSAPARGTSITISATLTYAAPPNLPLVSYPNVQLQASTTGPTGTFRNVSRKIGTTDSNGTVTFTGVTNRVDTTYRVSMVDHADSSPDIFTLFSAGQARNTVTVAH